MRQLWTMTVSDLRQRVRDRSVLIFALIVPLALMYVFNLVFGDTSDVELEPVTVAVSLPADDELAGAFTEVLGGLQEAAGMDVTVEEVSADAVSEQVESEAAHLGITVPEGFGAAVMAGEQVTVEVIEGQGSGLEADVVISVIDGLLDQFEAGAVVAAAGAASGVPPAELAALAQEARQSGPALTTVRGDASTEQLSSAAALVAGQAGLFLLFTVGFGVLGLVAEREQGTLARLRSMPMPPGLIVASKGLVSFVLGVVATSVLLTVGGAFFGVGFGSPLAVAVLILCVVTATTSLMFVVARLARTSEQASIIQSILALVLGIAGGAFFPVAASEGISALLDLNPVAAFVRGLGITAGGGGVGDIGAPVAIMLGFAVVVGLLSRFVPDRSAVL